MIVDREFPTLSGEILDFLQSLQGRHFVRLSMNVLLLILLTYTWVSIQI